jgi:hypothetical protein
MCETQFQAFRRKVNSFVYFNIFLFFDIFIGSMTDRTVKCGNGKKVKNETSTGKNE